MHDGARPLLSLALIDGIIKSTIDFGVAVPMCFLLVIRLNILMMVSTLITQKIGQIYIQFKPRKWF